MKYLESKLRIIIGSPGAGFQAGASEQWPSRVWFFRPNTQVGEGKVGNEQLLLE